MAALALAVLIVPGMRAAAQTAADEETPSASREWQPYRGLFGPSERDDRQPPRVSLNASLFTGADDTSRLATDNVLDEQLQAGRMHQGVQVSLGYVRRRPRSTFSVDLSSAVRYFPSLKGIGTQKHGGSLSAQLRASRRMTIQFAEHVSYSPSYQLALGLPGLAGAGAEDAATVVTDDVDYSVSRDKQMTYGTSAAVSYVLDRSRTLSANYARQDSVFFSAPDFHAQRAAVLYTHRLSNAFQLRAGYGLALSELGGSPRVRHHDLDIGASVGRSFAFSPHTSIGFSSGSAIVSSGAGREFQLTGSVQLRRALARHWTSAVAYQRGVQMLDRVAGPFGVDTLGASVSGYLNARTRLQFRPNITRGSDVADASRSYTSATSQTRLEVALTRHWALYAEHFFYRYAFSTAAGLPPSLAARLDRHGIRCGLALWAPLLR